jgi:Family of unknown function (DUF6941)
MNFEKPPARSLIICDYLVVEEDTRNVTLVNCFARKAFGQFPTPPITCWFYCSLSNGFGQFPIALRIERLESVQWEYEKTENVVFLDRLKEVRYYGRLRDIRFPVPGSYSFMLLLDGDILADTKIEIRSKGQ